jgi:hypothetical protein
LKNVRAVALLIALSVVSAVVAAAATAKDSAVTTIRLVEKEMAGRFVDNPPRGGENKPPSIGDVFAFTSELLTRSGKHAGMLYATCTVTLGGKNGVSTCFGTYALKGGQLQGMTTLVGEPRTQRIAIVGGTGIYAGVRGEVTSVNRGNSPLSDSTIRLLRP